MLSCGHSLSHMNIVSLDDAMVHPQVLSLGLSLVVPPPPPYRSQYKRIALRHMHNTIPEVVAEIVLMASPEVINVDIDTTGLQPANNDICRIVASTPQCKLSIFVMPECSFEKKASYLNKYTIEGIGAERQLLFKGKPVMTVAQKDALRLLYSYITKIGGRNSLLISHNCKGFLARFIVNKFKKYLNIKPKRLDAKGVRFADPLKILRQRRRKLFPEGIPNLKLPTVHRHLFPKRKPYFTPNASNDSRALRRVLKKLGIDGEVLNEYSFSSTEVRV